MAVYAISDLHLSFGTDKPMDVFGKKWSNYEKKIYDNWNVTIKDDDFVLLCGDISWATYIDNADKDFDYISKLSGTKIISKGNHDYWWCTHNKQKEFLKKNGLRNILFLHNNSYMTENGIAVCGARGWLPKELHRTDEDSKLYNRELQRLELSLKSVPNDSSGIIAMLHYPPDVKFMELLSQYGVGDCVYGHLHGGAHKNAIYGTHNGVRYNLTSCDYLGFSPLKIYE